MSPVVCTAHALLNPYIYPCTIDLFRNEPVYNHKIMLCLTEQNCAFSAKNVCRFISSIEQSDSTVMFQPDVNVNIIATQGITVTHRCHGKPSLVVTIPPGVFSVTLIYPCTLSADNWTIESQFRLFILLL